MVAACCACQLTRRFRVERLPDSGGLTFSRIEKEMTEPKLAVHTIDGVITPRARAAESRATRQPHRDRGDDLESRCRFCAHRQPAEIKVDTFSFTKYGLLHGTALDVSAGAIDRSCRRIAQRLSLCLGGRSALDKQCRRRP
jgi:hypothetical protein